MSRIGAIHQSDQSEDQMSSDVKFTPGPWTAKHVSGSNFAAQEFDIRAALNKKPHIYPVFNRNSNSIEGDTVFVSPADAYLIAAAPEMYEALKACIGLIDDAISRKRPDADDVQLVPDGSYMLSDARAALAKAEGKS